MTPEHLSRMAADLAEATTGRPRRTDLCRAVSAAYYALFHCLARSCADSLAGQAGTVGNRPMWRRVYRALEHRQARTRCENVPSSFPDGLQEFGLTFAMLQGRRHLADPDHPFSKSNVIADINNARTAIDRFRATPASARRDFAVLTKVRPDE